MDTVKISWNNSKGLRVDGTFPRSKIKGIMAYLTTHAEDPKIVE